MKVNSVKKLEKSIVELEIAVTGEVFKKVTVGFEFTALEAKALEVTDGEEHRHAKERERHEKYRSLGAFFVKNLG